MVKLKLLTTHTEIIRVSHQTFSANGLRPNERQTTENINSLRPSDAYMRR